LGKDKIQLLSQALNAATASLNLAKQLLSEVERSGGAGELPGLVGKYDGMFMVTEAGKKYPVPDNYAAKTKLVYGDKLKMIEGPEGRRFKLIEEVERVEEEAQLVVKDGRFEALGKDGSYKLIQGAVRYWNGVEGDKLKILLPKGEKNVPFAGLAEIVGKQPGGGEAAAPGKESPASSSAEKRAPKREGTSSPQSAPVVREEKKEEKSRPGRKEAAKQEKAPSKKSAKPLDEEELR